MTSMSRAVFGVLTYGRSPPAARSQSDSSVCACAVNSANWLSVGREGSSPSGSETSHCKGVERPTPRGSKPIRS